MITSFIMGMFFTLRQSWVDSIRHLSPTMLPTLTLFCWMSFMTKTPIHSKNKWIRTTCTFHSLVTSRGLIVIHLPRDCSHLPMAHPWKVLVNLWIVITDPTCGPPFDGEKDRMMMIGSALTLPDCCLPWKFEGSRRTGTWKATRIYTIQCLLRIWWREMLAWWTLLLPPGSEPKICAYLICLHLGWTFPDLEPKYKLLTAIIFSCVNTDMFTWSIFFQLLQ